MNPFRPDRPRPPNSIGTPNTGARLQQQPGIVVVSVPFHLGDRERGWLAHPGPETPTASLDAAPPSSTITGAHFGAAP